MAYERVNWENLPSTKTPVNADNLNKMDNAIDQNANNIGGKDYDATSTYDVGDIVKYQGQLYICTTAITTAEAWNSNHWQATDVLSKSEIYVGTEEPVAGEKVWFNKDKNSIYVRNSNGMYEEFIGKKIKYGSVGNPDSSKFQITYSRIIQVDNTVYVDIIIKILTEIPVDRQYGFNISGVATPQSAIYPLASYGVNEYNFKTSIYCYMGGRSCVLNNSLTNSAVNGFWKVHFSYNVD